MMPRKTYYKPNRSVPRYFKPCDVARAAYNCHVDNSIDRIEIIRCVVKGLGFEFVALPTEGKNLPDVIESKVDAILTLAGKLQSSVAIVRRALLELEKSLSFILKFVPDFITDDEKTVEDKLLKKALSNAKKVAKRSFAYILALDTLRDTVQEWEQDLKAFILNVGEAVRIVKTAKELYSAEVFFSERDIERCKCKRPRGSFSFITEMAYNKGYSIYIIWELVSGETGSYIRSDNVFLANSGEGNSSEFWQVDSDVFSFAIAIQAEFRDSIIRWVNTGSNPNVNREL